MNILEAFRHKLKNTPENIEFNETMAVIEAMYDFSPVLFKNGELVNEAGQNSGSCKLFAFAKDQQLSKEETLCCFGSYYFEDVLQHPEGSDHQNIRNFMRSGWEGIQFDAMPLMPKS